MAETTPEQLLDAALGYAALGWRVVVLKPRDKVPIIPKWQINSSSDPANIKWSWNRYPESNIGVQLGPLSGIIDVECDTNEAEHALSALFDGDPPVVPTYQASRGKHRLFKWSDDLPRQAVVKLNGIEFRLGGGDLGAQSVFPPSRHPSGSTYQWLVGLDDCELIELPADIRRKLLAEAGGAGLAPTSAAPSSLAPPGSRTNWQQAYAGVEEGMRNNTAASVIGRMLADLRDPTDNSAVARAWHLSKLWNVQNSPPIPEKELRATFNSVLQRHRINHTNSEFDASLAKYTDLTAIEDQAATSIGLPNVGHPDVGGDVAATGAGGHPNPATPNPATNDTPHGLPAPGPKAGDGSSPPGWRLLVVESRPRTYKLFSSLWFHRTEHGYITINSSDDLLSAQAVRRAALEQADLWIGKDFIKSWDGTPQRKGLAAQLMDTHTREAAPLETRRDLVVATHLYEAIRSPRIIDGDKHKEPDSMGSPSRLQDGRIVFKFAKVWEEMVRSDDKVSRAEFSELLKKLGAEEYQSGARDARVRLKSLDSESVRKLHNMIGLVE